MAKRRNAAPKETGTRIAWKLFSGSVTLIATLISYLAIIPRPVITPGDPVDPDNPFSARFQVSNAGYVPLTDVSIGFHPEYVQKGNATLRTQDLPNGKQGMGTFSPPEWNNLYLGADDPLTVSLSRFVGPQGAVNFADPLPWVGADISVIIKYHVFYLPWERTRVFRARLHKETNDKLYWSFVPPAT